VSENKQATTGTGKQEKIIGASSGQHNKANKKVIQL
jgi:hypothetical protein